MFLLISGDHICVPKLYKNMASPYKALLWCVKYCGPHRPETWTIVYISVYCNISFSWLLPLDCFQFIFSFALFIAWQRKRAIENSKYQSRDLVFPVWFLHITSNKTVVKSHLLSGLTRFEYNPYWLYIDVDHFQEKFGPNM